MGYGYNPIVGENWRYNPDKTFKIRYMYNNKYVRYVMLLFMYNKLIGKKLYLK